MYVRKSLLAMAAALVAIVEARTIRSPIVMTRSEGCDDTPMLARLDLAYQEASMLLGTDKVGKEVALSDETAEANWSDACLVTPYILIQPESAEDVSTVVSIINKYRVKFAVYSGGHSPSPGFSSIQKGILIHMGRLNQAVLSDDGKIASVGPGGRWGNVSATLGAQGAYVSGGRIPPVGVGGLLLGGGLHHTLAEFGLSADNVHNFEVVLADGSIVNANSQENTDLFWALKGGGPNFGIVTRYDLKTLPIDKVWYQWGVYSIDDRAAIFDAFVKWQLEGSADFKSTANLISTLNEITILLTYSAPVENPEALRPLLDIEPVAYSIPPTIGTYATLTDSLWGFTGPPARHEMGTASFRPDAEAYLEVYNYWHEKAMAVHERTNANQTFVLQPISHNAAAIGKANGGNALNIPAEDHTWWTTVVDWEKAEDDDVVRSVSLDTIEYWKKIGEERGIHLPFLYMNDASRDQNPLAGYGEENLQRLKEIAAKYDPTKFFQKNQGNGFLLSKV